MVGIFLLFSYFVCPVIWWNFSPSAPEGIYVYTPNQKLNYGDYAVVKLPVNVPPLRKGHRMLKQVQGFPEDVYTVTGTFLVIRDRKYPISYKKTLPHLAPGTFAIKQDSYLFLNNPDISFDSRYLGQIPKKDVLCKVNLLISFNTISDLAEGVKRYANW